MRFSQMKWQAKEKRTFFWDTLSFAQCNELYHTGAQYFRDIKLL